MLDYFGQNIASIIERLGRDITVRNNTKSGPDYDPVLTPVDTPNVKAAVFDYDASEVDGTTIQRNDKEFLIASTSTILKTSKLVDGDTYQIISLEEVQPGSELLLYIAQGRA